MNRAGPSGGRVHRAGAGHNSPGAGHPKPTCQAEISVPEIEWMVAQGLKRRRASQLLAFWHAQANAEADFQQWVLTYRDITGETAVNHVLRDLADALA